MNDLKYDPELPYVVIIREDHKAYTILGRCSSWHYAEDLRKAGTNLREIVDTTPKPKIPEDAEFITWDHPREEYPRFACRDLNAMWWVTSEDGTSAMKMDLLIRLIGDAEVTVLVRKDES